MWKKYFWIGILVFLFVLILSTYGIINYAYPFIPETLVDLVRKPELVKNAKANNAVEVLQLHQYEIQVHL